MKKNVHGHLYGTVIAKVALVVITLGQGAVISRLLGPEGRGLYSKLQAGLNFFILFLGFGLTSAIVYYFSNRKIAPAKVLGFSCLVTIVGTVALTGMFILFQYSPQLDFILPVDFREPFFAVYMVMSFATSQIQLLASAMLRARMEFPTHNRLEVGTGLLRLMIFSAIFLLPDLGSISLYTLFCLDLLCALIRGLWYWRAYRFLVGERADWNVSWAGEVKPIAQFSLLIYASFLLNFLYTRVDVWIIEYQAGLAELGIYSVAFGLASVLSFVPMTLNSVLFPHVAGVPANEGAKTLSYFSRLNFTALALGAAVICLVADPLLRLLYGSEFAGGANALRILCLATVLLSVKHLFTYYNVAQGFVRVNFICEGVALVLAVALNLLFVPRMGINGAALASLAANFVSCLMIVAWVLRGRGVWLRDCLFVKREDIAQILKSRPGLMPFEPAVYVLRLDDACPTYRREMWDRVESLLDQHGIKPIVGVIPENTDSKLHFESADPHFWDRVRSWQAKGWTIAMHGYRHELKKVGLHGNLVPIHPYSEFAAHSPEEQRHKIRESWRIFQRENVKPTVWMAPAHSFDRTTLQILSEETDLRVISDGFALFPYQEDGFLWLPQQTWNVRHRPLGVWTTCLHPNTMAEADLARLETQIAGLRDRFLTHHNEFAERHGQRARGFADHVWRLLTLWRLRVRAFLHT